MSTDIDGDQIAIAVSSPFEPWSERDDTSSIDRREPTTDGSLAVGSCYRTVSEGDPYA